MADPVPRRPPRPFRRAFISGAVDHAATAHPVHGAPVILCGAKVQRRGKFAATWLNTPGKVTCKSCLKILDKMAS